MELSWWQDEPNTRGTYSLVSSCIFTLGLCVWTAIHLNVPEQASGARQFLRKLVWLAVGLLAPELVTFTAWSQYADASRLVRHLAKSKTKAGSIWLRFRQKLSHLLVGQSLKSQHDAEYGDVRPVDPDNDPAAAVGVGDDWTLVHGFYAVMGGYVFDFGDDVEPFLPAGLTRLSLTTDGVRFVLEHAPELIPRVSEEDINDKSKADGLAKMLVAIQAAWFCLQCIARGAQHLPISLLEITTAGHALYTLITYVLWARKPMNISVPTVLTGDRTRMREICAYMFMCSQINRAAHASPDSLHIELVGTRTDIPPGDRPPLPAMLPNVAITLTPGAPLPGTGLSLRPTRYGEVERDVYLDPPDLRRWQLTWQAITHGQPFPHPTENYLVRRVSNTPVFASAQQDAARLILAFMVAEVLYAGIHALGWNAEFASGRLQLAWRAATCVIGAGGVFVAVFGLSWAFADAGKPYWDQTWTAVLVVGALELGIRMFLLTEALLSVKVLPPGVFQLPQWSTYIPHWA
ncbi:hypothetical protein C8R46DRAFT_520617 [Mycena filopes]|nr:hypothetical protein C8R46DRAFT_520617 [Mycena filopes]